MWPIPGLPTPGSDVNILIARVNINPFCELVELWGNFDQEQKAAYQCLAKNIQCPGKIFQELEGNPGDLCLVQVNNTWYRARIVSRNVANYSVFLIDKGFNLSTTTSMLAWGQNNFFHLPPEVEFCLLSNVLPLSAENRWSPMALEFLKTLFGKCVTAHILDVLVPNRTILLHIPCISKQMYEMGFAKMLTPERFKDLVLMSLQPQGRTVMSTASHQSESFEVHEQMQKQQQFMYPELQMGTVETVLITEVTNPLQVSCQLKVFSQELKKLEKQITHYYEGRLAVGAVRPNMLGSPCAARGSDGKWYRSVLQQVFSANSVVEVLQVDYGKKQFVQMENIRPLAVEFFRMPVVTYLCSLHGITDRSVGWTATQVDYLRSLLLYKTVIAKFEYQSLTEGVHYVTLYGDESTNINVLFSSKENCLLENEKSYADYAVHSTTFKPQHPVRLETLGNKAAPTEAVKKMERKAMKEICLKLPVEDLALNSSHVAVVQHVSNPSEFWIQTQKYANEFNELTDGIADQYSDPVCEDVVRNPTVGLYCAAMAQDDAFYRATVTEVRETQIQVYFVDHGNTEMVDRSNIRVLPDKFKELPQLALKCKLADVKPKGETWSHNATDFFTKTVIDKVLDVHVKAKCDGGYVVEVTDSTAQGERDVSKLMCSSGFAEKDVAQKNPTAKVTIQPAIMPTLQSPGAIPFEAYKNSGSCFQTPNTTISARIEGRLAFNEHLFPIGSVLDVNVSYIESPNDFWCQLLQSVGHLNLLMQDMQAYYAGSQFQPPVENACVARHPDNGMWYRAVVVQQRVKPYVDVLFVDYGQTKTVSLHDLRRISPAFLNLKGLAFRCSLYNPVDPTSIVNDWGEEATTRLQDFVDSAASSRVIIKCTIYAVMYNDQGIAFNVVDLETPFERVCNRMVPIAQSAPLRNTPTSSSWLHTYNYSTHNIKMGTEEKVSVTSVNSISHFYCQLERNADVVEDLAIKVGTLCQQLENLNLPKIIGAVCFAKYTDGHWYRGQIKATQPSILVHFVDYGDTIKLDKSHLLPIPIEASDIMAVPVQAVMCGLSGIPAKVPSEVNSWFETTATDHAFRALVVAKEPGGKLLVELYGGKTLVSAKIKEKFCIEMHSEEQVVYNRGRVLEAPTSDGQQAPNAVSKQECKVENETQAQKTSQLSIPKPLHPIKSEKKSSKGSEGSAPIPTHQVDEKGRRTRATLQLYQAPHQRTPKCKGNSFDPVEDIHTKPVKHNAATEHDQIIVLKSPITKTQKRSYAAPKSKAEALPKLTELPSKSITSGMEADVFISHCNSPLSFYVQLVKEEDDILSIVEKLNDSQSTAETLDIEDLHPGDLVNAEFPDDYSWYRAVVREIHGKGTALVEFLDFGNTATVSISKICKLLKPFLQIPRHSTHCLLSGVAALAQEGEVDPEVVSTFKQDIGSNEDKRLKCRFVRQLGSMWEVSLEDSGRKVVCEIPTRDPTAISDITPERPVHGEEKPGQHPTIREMPLETLNTWPLHYLNFSEGHSLEAYVATITDPQSFWCQSANSEELDRITESVSEVGNAVQYKLIDANMLSTGSPCIALFKDDEQWYRAEVVSRDGDILTVFFVDYGNESQVNVKDVREMPPSLTEFQPQAFQCQLEGFDASHGFWDDGALDQLSELLTNKLLQLTVLRVSREEESRTMCFVQVECEGQVINETMKAHWKSSAIENQHGTTGASDSFVMPEVECDSTIEEPAGPESHPTKVPENIVPLEKDPADSFNESLDEQCTDAYVEQQDELGITQEAETSEVPSTINNRDCLDDIGGSEPIADAQKEEENHILSECDMTDNPQSFTEGENLREMVPDIVDEMKTIPTIVISNAEPSDTGVIEPLSEDISEDQTMSSPPAEDGERYKLTSGIDENTVEMDKNCETEILSVMEQAVGADDESKSVLHSDKKCMEASTVAKKLGTKEKCSDVEEDESENVVAELKTLPEVPENPTLRDKDLDDCFMESLDEQCTDAYDDEKDELLITQTADETSEVANTLNNVGCFDDTGRYEPIADVQDEEKDHSPSECDMTDKPQTFTEGESLREMVPDIVDEMKTIPTIVISNSEPSDTGVIEPLSEDIGEDQTMSSPPAEDSERYKLTSSTDKTTVEMDKNSVTEIVSVMEQAVGVDDDSKSVLHSDENLEEAAASYGDQIQKNYNELFQFCLVAESTESAPNVADDLGTKEVDSHVGEDKSETVAAELETLPDEPERKDEDSNIDMFPDSEFGRLLRAGDTLPVGSTCVVWSPAFKSWCKATVLKNMRDCTLVLLVDCDTQMIVDPASIFEMVLSEPIQCDTDDSSVDFDTASSRAESPIGRVADTELAASEQQKAVDTVPTNTMGHVFVEATCPAKEALVSTDLVAETETLASETSAYTVPTQNMDNELVEVTCPAEESCSADICMVMAPTCGHRMAVEWTNVTTNNLMAEFETVASEQPADTFPIQNTCSQQQIDSLEDHAAKELSPEQECIGPIDDPHVEADAEVLSGAPTQHDPTEDLRDIMSEEETCCSDDDGLELQMSMLTHLFLLIEDQSDNSCIFSSETTSLQQQIE